MEANQDKEYYIATKDEKGQDVIYNSVAYKLSELDLINLIRICFVEERGKVVGRKLLEAYKDSTQYRIILTQKRLTAIGIKEKENEHPTVSKKPKFK